MNKKPPQLENYRSPSIVLMGSVSDLTKGHNGDICDGAPCQGLMRPFKPSEKGKKLADIPLDHKHDPKQPLTPPKK